MHILDVKIDNISKKEALEKITELLRSNSVGNPAQNASHNMSGKQLCTTNPEFILEAQKDEEFKNIINNSWLSVVDGYGIRLAAKYLNLVKDIPNSIFKIPYSFLTGMKIAYWGFIKSKKLNVIEDIIAGSDLVSEVSEICAKENKKVFLLGGFGDVPKLTKQALVETRFIASNKIDYSIFEAENILEKIKEFETDVLFVALSAPKAQKWINKNLKNLPSVKLAIGVGGSFDYISGKIKRAPDNWRYSFEWLFRLFKQPKRWKRIWNAWIVFAWTVFVYSCHPEKSRACREATKDPVK